LPKRAVSRFQINGLGILHGRRCLIVQTDYGICEVRQFLIERRRAGGTVARSVRVKLVQLYLANWRLWLRAQRCQFAANQLQLTVWPIKEIIGYAI
jgi:hypothetical protein